MPETIFVLNGPNMNLLGQREPEKYGRATLADVEALCRHAAKPHDFAVEFRQTNHEGELVSWIHEAGAQAVGIVLNPAAYTHTSIALLDAVSAITPPVIEVHITNVHAREDFRQTSYVSRAAKGVICGFGIEGYALAIAGLAGITGHKS